MQEKNEILPQDVGGLVAATAAASAGPAMPSRATRAGAGAAQTPDEAFGDAVLVFGELEGGDGNSSKNRTLHSGFELNFEQNASKLNDHRKCLGCRRSRC